MAKQWQMSNGMNDSGVEMFVLYTPANIFTSVIVLRGETGFIKGLSCFQLLFIRWFQLKYDLCSLEIVGLEILQHKSVIIAPSL